MIYNGLKITFEFKNVDDSMKMEEYYKINYMTRIQISKLKKVIETAINEIVLGDKLDDLEESIKQLRPNRIPEDIADYLRLKRLNEQQSKNNDNNI